MSFLSPSLKLENLSSTPIMSLDHLPEAKRYNRNNIVAQWWAPVKAKLYHIELEHGTTSGRRMVWVNGKEVLRRDWMFKLVGEDTFHIDGCRCIVDVEPAPGFKYVYSLFVDTESCDDRTVNYRQWQPTKIDNIDYRVMVELNSLKLYINDDQTLGRCEYVDGGTDTTFPIAGNIKFVLQIRSNECGDIQTTLVVNGITVPELKSQEVLPEAHASILSRTF